MAGFLDRLNAGEVLVADGATGTNYHRMGMEQGAFPEEWVLDAPQNVLALHYSFANAGSDIILTDSFGATRLRMHKSKYAARTVEINLRAAALAREAAAARENVLVGGSMGPLGKMMEPLGDLTHADVVQNCSEQAAALAEGGVDFLLLETFFSIEEAVAAIEGVKQASNLPLVVSFSYDQGTRSMMGLGPSKVMQTVLPLGVAAIGVNCGKTLEATETVLAEMKAVNSGCPFWVKPNAGLPRGIPPAYDVTPAEMAAYAVRFVREGAQIVGGCCGTTPEHVAAIAHAVRAMKTSQSGEPA